MMTPASTAPERTAPSTAEKTMNDLRAAAGYASASKMNVSFGQGEMPSVSFIAWGEIYTAPRRRWPSARPAATLSRMSESGLQDLTHTIQLAVAPVFLLTALGTTLAVLTTRLARIVDRARRVEARLRDEAGALREGSVRELRSLEGRVRLIHWALTLGTSAALLVCLLIAVAFLGYLFGARVGPAMAILFIAAMAAYVGALVCFLREVFIAIATLQFGLPPEVRRGGSSSGSATAS